MLPELQEPEVGRTKEGGMRMFFSTAQNARIYATLERIRTGRIHIVKPCKKYLCPPKQDFGKDHINGFTVVLGE